jgi:hypothetical protein
MIPIIGHASWIQDAKARAIYLARLRRQQQQVQPVTPTEKPNNQRRPK